MLYELGILRGFSVISCFVTLSNNKKVFSLISLKKKKKNYTKGY